jgi:DNA-binding MarR family transcriptional regulator
MTAVKQANRAGVPAGKKPAARARKAQAIAAPSVIDAAKSGGEARARSKRALLIQRISRPGGARIDDLTEELGWLPHTVRAALTGLRRKGYVVARETAKDGSSVYRAMPPAGQNVSTSPTVKKAPRAASKRAA